MTGQVKVLTATVQQMHGLVYFLIGMKWFLHPTYAQSEQDRFDYFKNEISRHTKAGGKFTLLDVGCSQLDFGAEASDIESFGIDIHNSKVYDAAHFKQCNLDREELPFDDKYFDIVVAGEVIEHIKRPFEFIEESSRVLKNKGVLLLSTPHPHYYLEILKELFGSWRLDDEEHLNLFSRIHLSAYAKKYNLELERVAKYKFWIPLAGMMITSVHTPPLFNYQNIYTFRKQ